ncbi:hypothetical protein [Aeoliella sp. SH292]|uniref:hypothetical protein n=1 Tax=Aeoliella sp. SH292 TaxID=3454464 RepID=UPI003F9AFC6B
MQKFAIGSSYLFNQGTEPAFLGGLELQLRRAVAGQGKVSVDFLSSPNDGAIPECFDIFVQEALRGVQEASEKLGVKLEDFEIHLSRFAYHDVDSAPNIYRQTAEYALKSAFDAWNASPLPKTQ